MARTPYPDLVQEVVDRSRELQTNPTAVARASKYLVRAQARLIRYNEWPWRLRSGTAASVANQEYLDLPADAGSVVRVSVRTAGSEKVIPFIGLRDFRRLNVKNETGVVERYFPYPMKTTTAADTYRIGLWRTPTAIVTYTIDYDVRPNSLLTISNVQYLNVPEEAEEGCVLGARWLMFMHKKDSAEALAKQDFVDWLVGEASRVGDFHEEEMDRVRVESLDWGSEDY